MTDPQVKKLLNKARALKQMSERLIEQSRQLKEQSNRMIEESKKLTIRRPKI